MDWLLKDDRITEAEIGLLGRGPRGNGVGLTSTDCRA